MGSRPPSHTSAEPERITIPGDVPSLPWDHPVMIPFGQLVELETKIHLPLILSTRQAADRIGWSPKWWRKRAGRGEIEGAFQEGGSGGPWRIPRDSALRYAREYARRRGSFSRRGLRGPRRKGQAEAPQTA